MKYALIFLLGCFYVSATAQITAPDTACVGQAVTFTTTKTAVTYSWDFSPITVVQPLSPISAFFSGGLATPAWACYNKDGANYYAFVTEYNTQQIKRLSYGASIHSVPTVTSLGTFGMTAGSLEGIDIVKDTATGNWFGVAVNWNQMVILSFGASLASTPTATVTSYPANMFWTHQVTVKRYQGNWIAFIANRSAGITRFEFGSSLTNVPTITNIPNVGGVANPCNFCLYQQGASWYMLITNLINGTLSRYDFGANLLNNAPTGTLLPSPPGMVTLPRYICVFNDCGGNLLGYMGNETGNIIKVDFAGNITNPPVFTNLGPSGTSSVNAAIPLAYSDTFCIVFLNYSSGTIYKYNPLQFSPPTYINYYTPTQVHTYAAPGTYNVTLFCDMGYPAGPSVYCKSIVVLPVTNITARHDTAVCLSSPLILSASVAGSHLWSTGATTSSISVSSTGAYWIRTDAGACVFKSDTTHVAYTSVIPVNLGNDTAICVGGSITLSPVLPAGASLLWSNGSTGTSISVSVAGTYWLMVNSAGCIGSDTMQLAVNPVPSVNLGPDKTICAGDPLMLQSSDTYVMPSYLWSTGSASASINATSTGVYRLQVTDQGCTGEDSVLITVKPSPIVDIGNDMVLCPGVNLILRDKGQQPGVQYLWSTGGTESSISVTEPGTYKLTITQNGCSATALVNVVYADDIIPVNLGPDTSLCLGQSMTLNVNDERAHWSKNKSGSTFIIDFPGTYWVSVSRECGIVSDTINVYFHRCDIDFPSAFTPNGDGLNDRIGVVGTLKHYKDFSLSIFNRFGERVFYTENIYDGWDGVYKGVKQDMGAYFYMIYYSLDDKKNMMKGDFQLIR